MVAGRSKIWKAHPGHSTADSRSVPPSDSRTGEVRELGTAIQAHRLITLTGAGGCGKTRLATNEDVPPALAETFGVREEPDRPLLDTLASALGGRP